MSRLALGLVIAMSVAIGFFLGISLPLLISTVVGGPVCVGEDWGGHGELYVSEVHADNPRFTLMVEVRENVLSECSAQLAERQGLSTTAALALVQSRWQMVDLIAEQAVEAIEANDMRSEDRTHLYAAFGRSCMEGAEVLYFGGQGGGSVHWQPNREPGTPYIESRPEKGNGAESTVYGPEGQ